MNGGQDNIVNSPDLRYERLSQLLESYELGSITHEQFERTKRQILLGDLSVEREPASGMELIVASFYQHDQFHSSINRLVMLATSSRHSIIDSALVIKSRSGETRIRPIAGLTRLGQNGVPQVIVPICGLLLPHSSIRITRSAEAGGASLSYMAERGIIDADLRRLGQRLRDDSYSVVVLYWSHQADEIANAFSNFDDFARRILPDNVAAAVTDLLSGSSDD